MNTQPLQKVPLTVRRTIGNRGWWLSLGLVIAATTALVIYVASQSAPTLTRTDLPIRAQTVPEAGGRPSTM